MSLRYAVLTLLVAQNSLYTLLRRYSRGVLKESVSSAAVLLAAEALKFAIAACFVEDGGQGRGEPSGSGVVGRLRAIRHTLANGWPMAVPAIAYLIMNLLSFKAIELVDATVFAMIAQLKLLSTAVATMVVLNRRLSTAQWRAILTLTLAVVVITYQRGAGAAGAAGKKASKDFNVAYTLGVGMVLLEISLSGWISAYFEKHLKDGAFSVWGRNLQLAFWSLLVYSGIEACSMVRDPSYLESFTKPWSAVTLSLVALGGGGGLLVAFAIKLADAVVKSMATSFALVVVVAAEMLLLGAPADPVVCLSSGIALLSLQSYSEAPKAQPDASLCPTGAAQSKALSYPPVPLGSSTAGDEECAAQLQR